MFITHVSSRAVLRLCGDDTLPFLQGLVTNDVMRLPKEGAQYALMLTPQGKFLYGFFLIWQDGVVLLDVEKARGAELLKRLMMYRLRSKVEIVHTDLQVLAHWGDGAVGMFVDPRLSALGYRSVVEDASGVVLTADEAAYQQMRIRLGVPDESVDLVADKSFPMQFRFDDLHTIDFGKGCYVGQEVTARTKYLGVIRKALYQVRGIAPLPSLGTAIYTGDVVVGEMLSSTGDVGLALLQVEHAAGVLRYEGGELSAVTPIWSKNLPSA